MGNWFQRKIASLFLIDVLTTSVGCVYLPHVLPLSPTDFVPEGVVDYVETMVAIAAFHPLAGSLVKTIKCKLFQTSRIY